MLMHSRFSFYELQLFFAGLDLKAIVLLPPGEDLNDWIAVHVVDFFNRINLIYGTVSDFCTNEVC